MNLSLLALSLASAGVFASETTSTVPPTPINVVEQKPTKTSPWSMSGMKMPTMPNMSIPKVDMSNIKSGMSGMKMPTWMHSSSAKKNDDVDTITPKEKNSIRSQLSQARKDINDSRMAKGAGAYWKSMKESTARNAEIAAIQSGTKTIHSAVKAKNVAEVERLLALGANVNKVNVTSNHAPIHLAVKNCDNQMLTALIQNGANVNVRGGVHYRTPLHYAIEHCGCVDNCANVDGDGGVSSNNVQCSNIIKTLLSCEDRDLEIMDYHDNTPLALAIRKGNVECVRALIDAGALTLKVPTSDNIDIQKLVTEKVAEEIMERPSAVGRVSLSVDDNSSVETVVRKDVVDDETAAILHSQAQVTSDRNDNEVFVVPESKVTVPLKRSVSTSSIANTKEPANRHGSV